MDPKYLDEMLIECQNKDLFFAQGIKPGGGSDDDDIVTMIGNYFLHLLVPCYII